jgi:hypothetical protein
VYLRARWIFVFVVMCELCLGACQEEATGSSR